MTDQHSDDDATAWADREAERLSASPQPYLDANQERAFRRRVVRHLPFDIRHFCLIGVALLHGIYIGDKSGFERGVSTRMWCGGSPGANND